MGKYTETIDRLDQAIDLDQAYVARDCLEELDRATSDREVAAYYSEYAAKVDKIREDIALLTELLGELNNEDGWTQSVNQKDGTKVYFKKEEDSPFLMTKLEALLPCTTAELPRKFISMLSLFNETDLMPKWFPMGLMKSHETLLSPTPFTKSTHIKIKLPFPISQVFGPRECVIQGKGYDLSERSAAAISVRPLEIGSDFYGMTVPEPEKGYTRFVIKGAYYFEMKREGIVFKQMQQLDLKSKLIPTPVMNWLSKGQLPLQFLGRIKGKLDKYEGSEWENRVAQDTELYPDVEKRLVAAVKKEFGVEAVPLRDEQGRMRRKKTMRNRLSSTLGLGKKKKKLREEDQMEVEPEQEEEPVLLDTTTEVLRSLQKVTREMFDQCTETLGLRSPPATA